jgi:hypothetical protein
MVWLQKRYGMFRKEMGKKFGGLPNVMFLFAKDNGFIIPMGKKTATLESIIKNLLSFGR